MSASARVTRGRGEERDNDRASSGERAGALSLVVCLAAGGGVGRRAKGQTAAGLQILSGLGSFPNSFVASALFAAGCKVQQDPTGRNCRTYPEG